MSEQPVPAWFASHIMGALTAAFPSWPCAPRRAPMLPKSFVFKHLGKLVEKLIFHID